MSSMLPFLIVAVIMAVVASMALGAAAQPATDEDQVRRDPWRERLRPVADWCVRSARDVRAWLAAGMTAARSWWRDRRARRAAARAEHRARRATKAPAPATPETASATPTRSSAPPAAPSAQRPDGVLTTALRVTPDIAVAETVGEDMPNARPSAFVRLRSGVGLVALITVIGLGVAAALAAATAAISAALDGFIN